MVVGSLPTIMAYDDPNRVYCARTGCTKLVPPKKYPGGKDKKFCSSRCRSAQWDADNPRVRIKSRTKKEQGQ